MSQQIKCTHTVSQIRSIWKGIKNSKKSSLSSLGVHKYVVFTFQQRHLLGGETKLVQWTKIKKDISIVQRTETRRPYPHYSENKGWKKMRKSSQISVRHAKDIPTKSKGDNYSLSPYSSIRSNNNVTILMPRHYT